MNITTYFGNLTVELYVLYALNTCWGLKNHSTQSPKE